MEYITGLVIGMAFMSVYLKQIQYTKQPVTPTMIINIENGLADTTYIYKF